jgi:hypothetical protein
MTYYRQLSLTFKTVTTEFGAIIIQDSNQYITRLKTNNKNNQETTNNK